MTPPQGSSEVPLSDELEVPAAEPTFDRGLRIALAVTLPIVLFCAIYGAMQARFVARDTAALRDEVEALHTQVVKLQQRPVATLRPAVASPRPTPRKGKKAKASDDGGGKSKAKAAKSGKRKAGKAKAKAQAAEGEEAIPARDIEGKPRRKAGKAKKGRGKKGRKKGKGAKAEAP